MTKILGPNGFFLAAHNSKPEDKYSNNFMESRLPGIDNVRADQMPVFSPGFALGFLYGAVMHESGHLNV